MCADNMYQHHGVALTSTDCPRLTHSQKGNGLAQNPFLRFTGFNVSPAITELTLNSMPEVSCRTCETLVVSVENGFHRPY